jgi:hypothetical protein
MQLVWLSDSPNQSQIVLKLFNMNNLAPRTMGDCWIRTFLCWGNGIEYASCCFRFLVLGRESLQNILKNNSIRYNENLCIIRTETLAGIEVINAIFTKASGSVGGMREGWNNAYNRFPPQVRSWSCSILPTSCTPSYCLIYLNIWVFVHSINPGLWRTFSKTCAGDSDHVTRCNFSKPPQNLSKIRSIRKKQRVSMTQYQKDRTRSMATFRTCIFEYCLLEASNVWRIFCTRTATTESVGNSKCWQVIWTILYRPVDPFWALLQTVPHMDVQCKL